MEDEELELKEHKENLKKYKSLETLGSTEGGKILIEALVSDIVGSINSVTRQCSEMPEIELRIELAKIGININILNSLNKAKSNVETLEEIIKSLSN